MARFVLVDDSRVARLALRRILERDGHKVEAEGSDGVEGYDLYVEHKPDVITLDVTMPGENGLECLKRIKRDYPAARVIMVSSVDKLHYKKESLMEGAMHYLTKPFDEGALRNAVDMVVSRL